MINPQEQDRLPILPWHVGVIVPPDLKYAGKLPRGREVVKNLFSRGRHLELDLFEAARQ